MCPELAVIDMVYPNYSDFTYCEMIDKSDNWLLISGSFSVKEAFNYLHIGNFYELNRTQYIQKYPMSGTNSNASYYFVDDVCLSHNPATCPARQLDLLPPTATCVDGQVVLDAGPGSVHYAWVYDGQPLPCDTGQTIVADRAGWYRVVVGRQQSCGSVYTFTDSVYVSGQCRARLQPCEPSPPALAPATPALPSAFSPNNDGLNDTWPGWALPPLGGNGGLSGSTRVTLYSRWGVAVYSGPLHPGWDGRAPDGTPAPEGVYAYTLHTPAGQLRSGTVTLVR
jgi:gliding motility-associated-like protein